MQEVNSKFRLLVLKLKLHNREEGHISRSSI